MTNCKDCRSHLADLLLDDSFAATHPALDAHVSTCADCARELAELRATFALLDEWKAPEVSPYFDTKLHARLREAVAAEPEGFFERMRSFFLYSTGRTLRPAMAGALAVVMVAGGGSAVFFNLPSAHPPVATSATLNDLNIIDNNSQTLQQMDQLLDDSSSSADDSSAPPTT